MPKPAAAERTELERIARAAAALARRLARLAEREAGRRPVAQPVPPDARRLRALIAARRTLGAQLGLDVANPGWSLMLELYLARLESRPLRPAALARRAGVPRSTALRWIDRLDSEGFLARRPDPARSGAILLALTDDAAKRMAACLAALDW